jgi:two-component system cell cycle response regulator PopA
MRITIRSPDARRARDLQQRLDEKGFRVTALLGPKTTPDGEAIDLCLLDADAPHQAWAQEECARIRERDNPPLGIVGLCEAHALPAACDIVDGWLDLSATQELLQRQASALIRAAEARAELSVRELTAAGLGFSSPVRAQPKTQRLLFIGWPDPFYLALEHHAAHHEAVLEAAFSSFTGFDRLHDERFDAVILNAAPDPSVALSLCGALRRNARLHHTPTLMITAPQDDATAQAAIERGAAVIHDATRAPDVSLAWLNEAIRITRDHESVETRLAQLRQQAKGAGDLMNADFFAAHVGNLAEFSHRRGRDLSLVALRVLPAPGAREQETSKWTREVNQIAALAGRLLRAHDSAALLDDDVIMAAIPGADLAKARASADRIAAVAECTAFAAGESDAGPIILAHSLAVLAPGESGAGLMARAQDAFRSMEMRG